MCERERETFSLSVYPSVGTKVASVSWLLLPDLLRGRGGGCIHLFELVFSFSLEKYSEVELLGHVVVFFYFVEEPHTVFHGNCAGLHSHQQDTPLSSHPH